ncbi:TRAP transporter small permease [Brevibacillus fulvus]|uniref:TRAP-type C4-dicarboxylate transport system permease small subunit n=1 Tax=Brevibacillus fulvus TaxID=1125967 RepID=A0A938Y063_9BACL|nr:TRAP transporter small permease [Brevibacillus fulvus]MBM7589626.1 TRAP-type C4-dicarboxylate transport system permease small subunit [Brevibacillus fulvus]
MEKLTSLYIRVERFVTNLLMFGVVLFVFFAAVMRWVGYPIAWSVEFAQLLFAWVIFLGANRALRENSHIGVDMLAKRLPEKAAFWLDIAMKLLMLFFLIFVGGYGLQLTLENSGRLVNNMSISYSFITLSVPMGCLLMIVTLLAKLVNLLRPVRTKTEKPDAQANRALH